MCGVCLHAVILDDLCLATSYVYMYTWMFHNVTHFYAMIVWMDGWTDRRTMDGWMEDGWMDGWTDRLTDDGWIDGSSGWMDGYG